MVYKKKTETNHRCPLDKTFDVFRGKWNMNIYCMIYQSGTVRYTDFRKMLPDISDPVLASTLKHLMKNGIVERFVYDEIPMRVEYSLTEQGAALSGIFKQLCKWTSSYYDNELGDIAAPCRGCECYGSTEDEAAV